MSLLIFTSVITPRVKYSFDLIFKDIIGIPYELTHSKEDFQSSTLPKINYSENSFSDELFFFSSSLLFEKGIHQQDISVFDWEGSKAFFATHPRYALPFDPFAVSFYLVTRYEEYLPHKSDVLGRYDVKESIAWQKGFLQKPLVNVWANKIGEILKARYPQLDIPKKKYQYLSTIDIDNAYAFKEKGIVRTIGALARGLIQFDGATLRDRISVLLGMKQDPYDTYEMILQIHKRNDLKCIWFFLLGDYGENDKNVSISSKKLQSLIKYIADYSECAIHPSFASYTAPEKIILEKSRLRKVIKRDVTKSRQHFLMLKFPDTYRSIIQYDITDDYTMGYSGEVGFRASICTPFYFYDLGYETKTKLQIHPFAFMDATFLYYLKLKPAEALNAIKSLVKEVKAVDGTLISLWHNESLSNMYPWKGWRNVYEQMVEISIEDNA